jgi:hypothetical protein
MTAPTLRPAAVDDAAEIHELMLKLATHIPLAVEGLEQEEALYAAVRKVLALGQSWVAADGERIVGFVLVDSAEVGRHWGENELLSLRYAGGEMLDGLIRKVVDRAVPINATVKEANRTGLAARLERLGFKKTGSRLGEQHFHREPG